MGGGVGVGGKGVLVEVLASVGRGVNVAAGRGVDDALASVGG